MQLRFSPTSPYTRKVVVTARECGLFDRIEIVLTNPFDPETDLGRSNPLVKVPTLVLDGGEVLFDSPVICEYLDSLHDGVPLFPPSGGRRWTALRRQALGDGIMDAAVVRRLEGLRPDTLQWDEIAAKQNARLNGALDVLEDEVAEFEPQVSIGHIAVGCALGYLDLRFPDLAWRENRPRLAAWNETFAARPSMVASAHPAA